MVKMAVLGKKMLNYLEKNCIQEKKGDERFVDLSSIDSSIINHLRYIECDNFTGCALPGYTAKKIILTQKAAFALSLVQKTLKEKGFSLVVYDAYRPQKAVDFFKKWALNSDVLNQNIYYPNLSKPDLFKNGYIAEKSSHSKGSTVDVTIISLGKYPKPEIILKKTIANGESISFLDDGTLDMGTHFDFLHEASWHDSSLVSKESLKNRNILRDTMKEHGFSDYAYEWWHYTLNEEPYPDTYFDFDIE